MLHNIRTRSVQEIKQNKLLFSWRYFYQSLLTNTNGKYKISEYHVVWGTPWFLMWSSHCKVAKFLLPLGISRKYKIAHVKKKICVLKWLSAQVKIWFCVHERDVLVMCNESSRVCCLFYLEWHASCHYSLIYKKKSMLKRSRCNHYQYSGEALKDSWHWKEHHGRLYL